MRLRLCLLATMWVGALLGAASCSDGEEKPGGICSQPREVGPCEAAIPRFYYNAETSRCEGFSYGGCGGNDNNFATRAECDQACPPPAGRCALPSDPGMCKAAIPRFYFNAQTKTCEEFSWGGCGGNANNFLTQAECEQACP
jgi:hypothetical protein